MNIDHREAREQSAEHARIQCCITRILRDSRLSAAAQADSVSTFRRLGLSEADAVELFKKIQQAFCGQGESQSLASIEEGIFDAFQSTRTGTQSLVQKLDEALSQRAQIIAGQLSPNLEKEKGIFDMGTGDGDVSCNLRKEGFRIDGAVDVIDYRKVPPQGQDLLPFRTYDGERLPYEDAQFAQSIMTNVAHHAGETQEDGRETKGNDAVLREICRVTRDSIVVIETIPDPALIKQDGLHAASERTRWNDYLYNRLFHAYVGDGKRTDIPVPGRYETAGGWVERFQRHGWKLRKMIPLGYDQPTINDYHILYVFVPADGSAVTRGTRQEVHHALQQ